MEKLAFKWETWKVLELQEFFSKLGISRHQLFSSGDLMTVMLATLRTLVL